MNKHLPILLSLLLVTVGIAYSQTPPTSRIWMTVAATPHDSVTMDFGNDVHGTYGIDDGTNGTYNLREGIPLPPPPGGLEVYWTDIPGRNARSIINRDYRSEPSDLAMKDTFCLHFDYSASGNVPIRIGLPGSSYLRERCDSMFLTYDDPASGMQTIDMFTTPRLVIDSAGRKGISSIFIYKYGVKLVDAVINPHTIEPTGFSLNQAFPNPFNSSTNLSYYIATRSRVRLKVFDVLGREIAVLTDEDQSSGDYSVKWSADGVASGVYFYQITAGEFTQTKKLQLVK